ncbi:MAG TPA: hypothetical protein VHL11_25725 [Phototrophicaceae bacterium]|nr:hypothetical protein [Phototrophicaceae bacterium]
MILSLVLGIGYLVLVYLWITNYFKRIEPYLLKRIGDRLGVKISRRWRNWEISGKDHTWQQGCLVSILELLVTMTFLIAPFWVLILVVLMIALITGSP